MAPVSEPDDDDLLLYGGAAAPIAQSLADTATLSDTLGLVNAFVQSFSETVSLSDGLTPTVTSVFPDTFRLGDTLVAETVAAGVLGDTLALGDMVQVVSRRVRTGSSTTWQNPPRLANTRWAIAGGSCACGLGHVGPQGCAGAQDSDVVDPLTLSDALTVGLISDVLPALVTGFEGGIGESQVGISGANFFNSFTWGPYAPYLDTAPPVLTDVVHSGTYSMQLGGLTGSASGLFGGKTLLPSVSPPFTISHSLYVNIRTLGTFTALYLSAFSGTGQAGVSAGLANPTNGSATVLMLDSPTKPGGTRTHGTVPLAITTMYRLYVTMTVAANGTDFTQEATLYLGDTMTVVDTVTYANTNYTPTDVITVFKMGDIVDNDRSLNVRVDDVKLSTAGLLPRGPYAFALMNPNTDVSTQWTRSGTAVAASNALNVGRLPAQWELDTHHANATTNGSGLVDRFGVDVSRVPNKTLVRGYVQARSVANATHAYTLRVWDSAGNIQNGPLVTGVDGACLSQRTDDLMMINLRGVSVADLAHYQLGYVSSGSGSTTGQRQILELWATIEYDPTS